MVPAVFGPAGVVGGAERYAWELARHMASERPTTLLAFGAADAEERVGELRVRTIGRPWLVRGQAANPFSIRILPEVLRAGVVHCHQQHILASSVTALAARLGRRRVFCSDLGGGGWDVSAYVSTDRWFHGHLHISEFSRRQAGHEGDPRAAVILGGVDTERFSPDPEVPRGDAALFVGRLLPHKGVDDFVDAIPDGLRAIVVGPAPDAAYLDHLRRLAAGKAIEFRHDVDDAALVDAYRRARCVVLPSVYRNRHGGGTPVPELLGQTLIEAMACAAPGVCTDVASLPEVIVHGETGFVVPPNDPASLRAALVRLRDDPALADRLGRAGRRRVLERFTWPAVVARCLDLYERLPLAPRHA